MIIVISGGSVRLFGLPTSCDSAAANSRKHCIKNIMKLSALPRSYYSHANHLTTPFRIISSPVPWILLSFCLAYHLSPSHRQSHARCHGQHPEATTPL